MQGLGVNGVYKRYQDCVALDGVDLSIEPGEFVSIVGPSGCGKSTLLRIVAGLEEHDAGEVWIKGRQVDHLSPKHRDIAMVFQTYALYPHMTAFRNIATPMAMRRLSPLERLPIIGRLSRHRHRAVTEIADRVRETATLLDIESLLDRKPGQMSGGQRQRVALGRAIIREPSVFLMDEPLSNLDAGLRVNMCAELLDLHRRLGVTCLYVTHDQAEAMKLSHRMAVMFDGRIYQIDAPEAVYHAPSHIRVAQFVGSPAINLIPATVKDDATVTVSGFDLPIRTDLAPFSRITLGLRPEALHLGGVGTTGLTGAVAAVEGLGSETIVRVRPARADMPEMALRLPPYHTARPRPDDAVTLHPDPRRCLVFHESGARADALVRDDALAIHA